MAEADASVSDSDRPKLFSPPAWRGEMSRRDREGGSRARYPSRPHSRSRLNE